MYVQRTKAKHSSSSNTAVIVSFIYHGRSTGYKRAEDVKNIDRDDDRDGKKMNSEMKGHFHVLSFLEGL